ncbi:MAG: FHA domain-containing protein [Phycisphaerae bacterium]|nr:FHA domain-containing protein [Phycisphaerae bacterium]
MRLLVKRGATLIGDLRFSRGPVYVGRHNRCQVFLPDRSVSRRHAVLFTADDGSWMAEDLDSSNRTTVNNKPIVKVPLRDGDTIGIADFSIDVHFTADATVDKRHQAVDMGETIMNAEVASPTFYQNPCSKQHTVHLNACHLKDFYELNLKLFQQRDQESLLAELTALLLKQFDAYHVWAGLRETTSGPLTCHCGRGKNGSQLNLAGIPGQAVIKQAITRESFILLPNFAEFQDPADTRLPDMRTVQSMMCAPIAAPEGVYGVIYVDNHNEHIPFNRQDMDYLSLISIQTAALIEIVG